MHCGAALDTYFVDSGATRTTDIQTQISENLEDLRIEGVAIPAGEIAFFVEGTSKPVFSCTDNEFILGRQKSESSEALLDLSALGGYHLGVSRRHVLIRRAERGYDVIDLSSSNGTWLNDERLIPNLPYPLASGSQLRLARMRLFVLYRPGSGTKSNT